jgi:exonuclease VII small subunit
MNKQEAQSRMSQLEDEIVMLENQVDILESDDFADTVPEVGTAIAAIKAYIQKAEDAIDECDKVIEQAERPAAPTAQATVAGLEGLTGTDVLTGLLKIAGILGRG